MGERPDRTVFDRAPGRASRLAPTMLTLAGAKDAVTDILGAAIEVDKRGRNTWLLMSE